MSMIIHRLFQTLQALTIVWLIGWLGCGLLFARSEFGDAVELWWLLYVGGSAAPIIILRSIRAWWRWLVS